MTIENFIPFIENLRANFLADTYNRSKKTLGDHLEQVQDIQGYYRNNADNPDWKSLSNIMKGATIYE